MKFDIVLELYNKLPTELQTIFLIVVLFLAYKGVIKIPWIPIGNKCKENVKKIWMIKTIETLYEQMNVFEVAHESIMFTLKKAYLDLTKDEKDNQHYELITDDAQKECKSKIRKWLRENHLTEYTDGEWSTYKKTKIDLLLETVAYHFDLKYKDNFFTIPRMDLLDKNTAVVIPLAIEKWGKAFDDCKAITKKKTDKIKELESSRK